VTTKSAPLVLALALLASAASGAGPTDVKIGETFTLRSAVLDEDRAYSVYLPASYRSNAHSYPVLYLLDGEAHFQSASGVVQFMSTNGNTQIPELIVVAITNTDRWRDLSPTRSVRDLDGKENPVMARSGGGERFLKFFETELIPTIEGRYRTLPYRMLVGHSLGGVLAIQALLSAPGLFQGIVAIDPALWWDDQTLVRRAKTTLTSSRKDVPGLRNAVYLSLAGDRHGGPFDSALFDEPVRALEQALEHESSPALRTRLVQYDGEDHNSVPLLSLYDGLLFVFDGYKPDWGALTSPAAVVAHFQKVSERLGVPLETETALNTLGYRALGRNDIDASIDCFKLNTTLYPGSGNVWDSLAEAYATKGEKALAISNYEKSLALDPANEHARKELVRLRAKD
jgi:predicted alpha/beta superfamily hydrolase